MRASSGSWDGGVDEKNWRISPKTFLVVRNGGTSEEVGVLVDASVEFTGGLNPGAELVWPGITLGGG